MDMFNVSEFERRTVDRFKCYLSEMQENDHTQFQMYPGEIDALVNAGLIKRDRSQGAFQRFMMPRWVVTQGYPNVAVYNRSTKGAPF